MFAEALADIEVDGKMANSPWYWARLTQLYSHSGQPIQSHRALDQLLQLDRCTVVDPQIIAETYAWLGDEKQALAWLERAYAQHSTELVSIKVSPTYDFLRGNPRFQDLIRRIGLST
jgi:hypothetical protein